MLQLLVLLFAMVVFDPPSVSDPSARLSGFYITPEKGNLLPLLEFKGERTVVVHSIISAAATYSRDGEYVLIEEAGKSPLLFRVQNADTIVGESMFAKGTYHRVSAGQLAEMRRKKEEAPKGGKKKRRRGGAESN